MPWMLEDINFYSVTKWEVRFPIAMYCIYSQNGKIPHMWELLKPGNRIIWI
jgi:hypothetical protein